MAYKAGSKIICEIMKSKSYPTVLFKNVGINCYRLHHFVATQDGSKTKRLGQANIQDFLLAKFFWRGFKQQMLSNLLSFKLMNPRRYVFKSYSSYSSGSLVPVKIEPQDKRLNDEQQPNHQTYQTINDKEYFSRNFGSDYDSAAKISEILGSGTSDVTTDTYADQVYSEPKRNLNHVAFMQKQDLTDDLRPKNQTRLKPPSRFNSRIPSSRVPGGIRHQFVLRKANPNDVKILTENLLIVNDDLKEKLNCEPAFSKFKIPNVSYSMKVEQVPPLAKSVEQAFVGVSNPAAKSYMEQNIAPKKHLDSMKRTMEVFRSNKRKVSSGVVSPETEIKSPLQSLMAKKEKGRLSSGQVRSITEGQVKNVQSVRSPHPSIRSQSGHRQIHRGNPEAASTAISTLTYGRFFDPTPKYRIKRDLISVIANASRIPIITRKTPKQLKKVLEGHKMEFMPLYKTAATSVRMQHSQQQQQHYPELKTWNFTPKKSRLMPMASKNYSYKYALNPKGTSLRKVVVVRTPKYVLPQNQNNLISPPNVTRNAQISTRT